MNDSNDSDTDCESNNDPDPDLERNILILRDFSLIAVKNNNISLTMHRLVQLTVRIWLKTHGRLGYWRGQFIDILFSEFPTGHYENWEKCRLLFPHVKGAFLERPKAQASIQQLAEVLFRGAWYALEMGYITESREMALKSRKYRLKIFGE